MTQHCSRIPPWQPRTEQQSVGAPFSAYEFHDVVHPQCREVNVQVGAALHSLVHGAQSVRDAVLGHDYRQAGKRPAHAHDAGPVCLILGSAEKVVGADKERHLAVRQRSQELVYAPVIQPEMILLGIEE